MSWFDLLGYLASLSVFATFCMNTMVPLRVLALGSNVLFSTYGLIGHLYPVLILHVGYFRSISTGSFRFGGSSAAFAPPRMPESPSTICSRSCDSEDLRRARSSSAKATPQIDCSTSRRARLRSAISASRSGPDHRPSDRAHRVSHAARDR